MSRIVPVDLVPYSRISFTQFSPHALRGTLFSTHALRGIKNKKAEECIEIINLNIPPRHLSWLIFPFTGVSTYEPFIALVQRNRPDLQPDL
jgi:hypothetical protein